MSLLALALFISLTSPAQRTPVEPAIARVIDAALADRQAPATDWSSIAARLLPHAALHGTAPSNDDWRNRDRSVYRRSGWLSASVASGGLALCGDQEQVHAVSISMPQRWLAGGDIFPDLAALGVTAVETDRQGPVMLDGAS